jgi:hypothetical protein
MGGNRYHNRNPTFESQRTPTLPAACTNFDVAEVAHTQISKYQCQLMN